MLPLQSIIKAITHTAVIIGVLCVSFSAGHAQTVHDSEGVSWERTLRIQGVIEEQDPFSESMLYDLAESQGEEIEASADNVHFEVVATHFWYALRDSVDAAYEDGRINGYTVRDLPDRENIFVAGTQVTYTDMLDSLSVYLDDVMDPADDFTHILNLDFGDIDPYWQFIEDMQFDAQDEDPTPIEGEETDRFVKDLSLFSMYELEMKFRVDETGFEIIPQALILGTAMFDDPANFNPDNWLEGFRSDFGNGVGLYLDLTEEQTVDFLIETGAQFSGEENEIPFYDLMTIFHYDFNFYAESDNILGGAGDFDYDVDDVYSTIMNRYVDFAYTHLYGQPPSWWQLGERGHFINGLFAPAIPEDEQVPDLEEEAQDELDEIDN